MVYITYFGTLYKLSHKEYREFLIDRAEGWGIDVCLVRHSQLVGLVEDVTNLSSEEAKTKLSIL